MKKILLIDDEFIFRQGLKYLMDWENSGYTIAGEASNGQEGLEKYFSLQPDVILCDVVMPVLGGVEFVRNLRKISQVPVVMLSNFDELRAARQAFQYGASDYLLKSRVTAEELLDCLNRITDDHLLPKTAIQEKVSDCWSGRFWTAMLTAALPFLKIGLKAICQGISTPFCSLNSPRQTSLQRKIFRPDSVSCSLNILYMPAIPPKTMRWLLWHWIQTAFMAFLLFPLS